MTQAACRPLGRSLVQSSWATYSSPTFLRGPRTHQFVSSLSRTPVVLILRVVFPKYRHTAGTRAVLPVAHSLVLGVHMCPYSASYTVMPTFSYPQNTPGTAAPQPLRSSSLDRHGCYDAQLCGGLQVPAVLGAALGACRQEPPSQPCHRRPHQVLGPLPSCRDSATPCRTHSSHGPKSRGADGWSHEGLSFCDGFTPLSTVSSGPIHIVAGVGMALLVRLDSSHCMSGTFCLSVHH